MKTQPLVTYIAALIVLCVWVGVIVVSTITHDYTGLNIITPVLMIIVGALFAWRRNGAN